MQLVCLYHQSANNRLVIVSRIGSRRWTASGGRTLLMCRSSATAAALLRPLARRWRRPCASDWYAKKKFLDVFCSLVLFNEMLCFNLFPSRSSQDSSHNVVIPPVQDQVDFAPKGVPEHLGAPSSVGT